MSSFKLEKKLPFNYFYAVVVIVVKTNSYSALLKFFGSDRFNESNTDIKSNLSLLVFVSGQIVIVGNGIIEMVASFSVKLTVTGLSSHFIQMF